MAGKTDFKPDSRWIRRSFLVQQADLDPQIDAFKNRFFTTALIDYTDTRPGGSLCINPPSQRTRFADIRHKSVFTGEMGKGRWYKEKIDENSQIIHLRFGVEEHNSLTSFFTGFYNSATSQIARTGRANNQFFYTLGKVAGFVVQLASWQLLAVHFLGTALKFLARVPHTKFYYSKPAMAPYQNAVATMVNHLAVNAGIVPRVFGEGDAKLQPDYQGGKSGPLMHTKMPWLFNEAGSIDTYAIMNRAKRRERVREKLIQDKLDQAKAMGITDMQSVVQSIINGGLPSSTSKEPTLNDYLQRWFAVAEPKSNSSNGSSPNESVEDTFGNSTDKKESYIQSLIEFGEAEADDGSQFISFRVNSTGSTQESFSNSVGETNMSSRINGISADSRNKIFDFSGGIGGALGSIVDGAVSAVTSFGQGLLDSVQLSGLAALAGSAFVDIPKYWQSASAQLPRGNYTINLVCWANNPIQQLLKMHFPLACLLAGVLPKSAGAQSYAGPFLVELYDRGRCQTRLGIIDNMTITRGTSNVGWTKEGRAMGIDVTFSVIDLSSIMHMPITENFSFLEAAAQQAGKLVAGETGQAVGAALTGAGFAQDTIFSDYMAVLAGMSLPDQIYGMNNLKLNLTRKMADFESWKSPSHMASFLGSTLPGQLFSAFYRGTDKQ
jgi:hypothetical protein